MALIHTLGADVLKSNVEARQAHHDARTNVNKTGIRKGTDAKPKSKRKTKADKVAEAAEVTTTEEVVEDEGSAEGSESE